VPEHIAFLIDENLTPGLVGIAHARGFRAVHAAWAGLGGKKDHQIAAYAIKHGLILVTNDLSDFRKIYRRKKDHPGIILLAVVKSDLMDREAQRRMFEAGLEEANDDEPIDEVIHVRLDENADGDWELTVTRYPLAKR
jgi:predicted nuclease of predicted toxin-antitoxin system